MKYILFSFCLIGFLSYSQTNRSNSKFKKITETESYGVVHSDGKRHIFTSEINEYHYDTLGNKTTHIRNIFYNKEPYKTITTNYSYSDDKIDYENSFIQEDSLNFNTIYSYLNGKLHKKETSYKTETLQIDYSEQYFYDENEKLKKSTYLYSEKDLYTEVYKRRLEAKFIYNKKEQIMESDWTKSDSSYKHNKIVHFRDLKGYRKKDKEYNKNNKLIKTTLYKYIFDDRDNWIIWKHYEKREPTKTIFREIEYYD